MGSEVLFVDSGFGFEIGRLWSFSPTRHVCSAEFEAPERELQSMEALGLSSSAKVWSAGALGTRCELLSNQRLENHMVCVGKHTALPQRNSVASKCGVYELLKAVEKKDRWGRKAFLKAGVARAHVAEKAASVEEITLQPIKTISGKIKLPGSKSLSNRTLLLAALSEVDRFAHLNIKFYWNSWFCHIFL